MLSRLTLLVLCLLSLTSYATIGGLTPDGAKNLDEVKKRAEPAPYVPANAPGCARWKGKGIVVRDRGEQTMCASGCALQLEDSDGRAARWVVSGERCTRTVRPAVITDPTPPVRVYESPPPEDLKPRVWSNAPGFGEAGHSPPGRIAPMQRATK